MSPPKEKGALPGALLLSKLSQVQYHGLGFLQRPFGWVFWFIEQRKARIQDRIANEERTDG